MNLNIRIEISSKYKYKKRDHVEDYDDYKDYVKHKLLHVNMVK